MSTPRARVVVGNDQAEVALLERRVLGVRYWEVPGGHVEEGETLLQAAVREVHEELGIELGSEPLHHTATVRVHHLYTADVLGRPDLRMSGPEVGRGRVGNTYRPRWVPRSRVPRLLLWPFDVRAVVVRALGAPGG